MNFSMFGRILNGLKTKLLALSFYRTWKDCVFGAILLLIVLIILIINIWGGGPPIPPGGFGGSFALWEYKFIISPK
jgi:hypothetical protein